MSKNNMNENTKIENSESKRRAVVAGLGAGIMSFAFFGGKSKNPNDSNEKDKIKDKINIEIHPSAIKRKEG